MDNPDKKNIVTENMPHTEILTFPVIDDKNGYLTPLEELQQIPFEVKRIYYIYGTQPNVVRGHHAHKQLKQVLIAISGSMEINCEYLNVKETYHLSSPSQGLLINGPVWRTMENFSDDAVLLVLASEHYKESEYIRSYDEFLKINKNIMLK